MHQFQGKVFFLGAFSLYGDSPSNGDIQRLPIECYCVSGYVAYSQRKLCSKFLHKRTPIIGNSQITIMVILWKHALR